MPVHSIHVVQAGSRSRSVLVFARDHERGTELAGLSLDEPGATAAYFREGSEQAEVVRLVQGTIGHHTPGGFAEVDRYLMPGVYQFDVPDEALARGSARAILVLRFARALVEPVEFDLVAYDPQDETCIGMTQLSDERRHQFLRQALPRMTEKELALGVEAEGELARRVGE
jgi:hypothetical protein